ncbi:MULTISPECIES: class I SAM-dependent methyltransferase [Legionella]|uniref:Class I SAM-dependent methyltransferase n=1 Tax=Legionella septentrionalis TaxID=2498109 RepID=A0A3S0XUH7_9GAMM|nr:MULTISPECIES: class I SAM-dependent methyltransferase [Legionella]MCP0914048.1 methyltransferase domain-containing protein [Legionella sp. 27cVA30]RUQ90790.1 class I SAM-dependent methyltransferase [Legionella septentrionalis]RUQ95022.1 class I SAM-dependent methyltransferase [Legionella septentrionalis]RUR09198.1 class I SAM-dependent methyltransferase [Legionella septentrionalis]RUR13941.1 class I SAM-dependent methyltransferase [Legionella septentrionalis]
MPTHLLSHSANPADLKAALQKIRERIKQGGDKKHVSVAVQLQLLDELSQFDFGRFLIQNRGINGYWTNYMLTHPWFGRKTKKNNRGQSFSVLEQFLLDKAPSVLATQERFQIFLRENQKAVRDEAILATIPSGMMGELLYLDYQGVQCIGLIGIDYDSQALSDAKMLAAKQQLLDFVELVESDAWSLPIEAQFDLISSNGLSIYEADDAKVLKLYKEFYRALKPKGKLVTSFLTFPPALTTECEWLMENINDEDLLLQQIIFLDILDAKFQCFRSSAQTEHYLAAAGFKDIAFIYDSARIFPTVIAEK